jgi:hypothetical protein
MSIKNIIQKLKTKRQNQQFKAVTFKSVHPDEVLSFKEWSKKFKVGRQYSIHSERKPQETISLLDICKAKDIMDGLVKTNY